MADYRGGHRFLMNAYRGSHSFFRQSIVGFMSFFGNPNPKINRVNTRRGYFFHYCCKLVRGTVQKTMCVWKRGGYAIFLTLMGGSCNFII